MKGMKGMKRFFVFVVAVFFCFCCLVGCWDGDGDGGNSNPEGTRTEIESSDSTSTVPADSNVSSAAKWDNFNPLNLPEYRELPLPSADEPAATMGMGETPSREKSSDDFYAILRDDLKGDGVVRLDFYGKPNYEEYAGSRTVDADDFFAGSAQEKVKAQEYYIRAYTYCDLSGYCFDADAHVVFLPNEFNRVLFDFEPTGSVAVPCYISNPAGSYLGGDGHYYEMELKARSGYAYNGLYNDGDLEFKIWYSYGNLAADVKEDEMELSVTASDGLHIMKFSFNLMDIVTRQRPLELLVAEVPTGTIGYDGEFGFENREITVDLEDGDVVDFPLGISGTCKGIEYLVLLINNVTRDSMVFEQGTWPVNGKYSFYIASLDRISSGETLRVVVYDRGEEIEIVSVDVSVGKIPDPITLYKDTFYPDGSENAPTAVAGQTMANIGSFVANFDADCENLKIIVYSDDYPLGRCLQNLKLFIDGEQAGSVIANLSSEYTHTEYTFTPTQSILKGIRQVRLFADVKMIAAPVMFNMMLRVAGTAGELFETPFVEGQTVCLVP